MFRYKNDFVWNDVREMMATTLPWDRLDNKSCLVTGANGMIATYVVYLLISLVRERRINIHVIALSRNRQRSEELFADFLDDPHFEMYVCLSIWRGDWIIYFTLPEMRVLII